MWLRKCFSYFFLQKLRFHTKLRRPCSYTRLIVYIWWTRQRIRVEATFFVKHRFNITNATFIYKTIERLQFGLIWLVLTNWITQRLSKYLQIQQSFSQQQWVIVNHIFEINIFLSKSLLLEQSEVIYDQVRPDIPIGPDSCSLRRTRSLAVIREETYNDLQITGIRTRRSQLIPRAKLVNRSFFKNR